MGNRWNIESGEEYDVNESGETTVIACAFNNISTRIQRVSGPLVSRNWITQPDLGINYYYQKHFT